MPPHEPVYTCHAVASFNDPVHVKVESALWHIVLGVADVADGTSGSVQVPAPVTLNK